MRNAIICRQRRKCMNKRMMDTAALVFFCCSVFLFVAGTVSAAPGEVNHFRCVKVGDRSATLRWEDPAVKDLTAIEVTYRSAMGNATSPSPMRIPAGVQTATIALPRNSVLWHFTARTVDKTGNKSKGVEDWYYVFDLPARIVRQNHFQGNDVGSGTPNGYATYAYDSSTGMVASIVEYDNGGNPLTKTEFEYGRGDVLWTKKSLSKWVSGAWALQSYDLAFYNPGGGFMDGALMRINSFSSAGTLTGAQVENFDSEGVFLGWSWYDGLGKEIFHTRFKGNASPAAGGMTQNQWTQYDPDGKLSNVDWTIGTADYDPLGYMVSLLSRNAEATPTWREQILYDLNGNPIQRLLSGGNPLALYSYDTYKY
jgi:hypothetical protein